MYQQFPLVVDTKPSGYANEVDTRTDIQIFWNTDLDRDHIRDSLFLVDDKGQNVNVQFSYDNRVIVIQPVGELMANTRYTLRIVGGIDGQNNPVGVRDILNHPLAKDFVLAFNTVTRALPPAPVPIYPPSQSFIQQQPQFEWSEVEGAVAYQIKVSTSSSLIPVVWPADSDITEFQTAGPVVPGYQFPDGTYYWAVRTVDTEGIISDWSTVHTFSKDTTGRGTQAAGDTVPVDAVPYYEEELATDFEILEIFPEDDQSNVDVRLKAVYVRINGQWTGDQIRAEDISFVGVNVDGMSNNPDYPDHGDVSFQLEVLPQNDGTTILKLTLDTVTFETFISTQF